MRTFVDLQGVSDAAYRFRHLQLDPHTPRVAGNFAIVRETGDGYEVLQIGQVECLADAPFEEARAQGAEIYGRLNVSERTRAAEHDDLTPRFSHGSARGKDN